MSDQSGSSHLQALFEVALQDYSKQTGIALAKHPLAEKLQNCGSVESITAVLREQTQAFSEYQEKDKVLKPLKKAVSVLHKLSATTSFGQDLGLNFPPVTAINTGLGVLLSAVKGVTDGYDSLVDLLESIESFLGRLEIYTKITPTIAMTEMIVKILVELLSTLSLATKQIKQGKSKKLFKKLFGGEKDIEAVLQRLDRLTVDEARVTTAQTFEVVCGLFQNMRVVMDDGKASTDHVMKALRIMQQIANDQNKSKRDKLQDDIVKWLSPPDPWKNHRISLDSRHHGSAAWFIEGNTYSEWKSSEASSSSLWIHGKPGAGKTVYWYVKRMIVLYQELIALDNSTIIEDVEAMRKAGLASLAIFYCDFREDQKKDLRGLLSSLLVQLSQQSDSYCDVLSEFYLEHDKGSRHPSDDALVGRLKDLLKLPRLAPVYLIVDALDECPNTSTIPSPRAKVLDLLKDLIKSKVPNLRICVTSRPETDIKDVLDSLIFRVVSLHDQREQKRDIEEYIKSVINTHPKNKRWKAKHKQLVIDVLTEKADGMFRWVYCQVLYICGCIPARIQHALEDLPETLDETYQRSLQEINKADWEFVHRLFQFVAVAFRPLLVEELAELLAFDFKAGSIPKFHEGWRLEDPVDAVLSTCSSLLSVVDGGNSSGKVIQFSHFSVKEYLTSDRLAEASDTTPRRYHVSMTPAHNLAAQACLGILLHFDEDIRSNCLAEWPLAEYAAGYWVGHARFRDVSRNVEDGLKQLFDSSKPHLTVCVWIHDPRDPYPRDPYDQHKRPWAHSWSYDSPVETSLHYAASLGFHFIIDFLVIEHSQNVHSKNFTDGVTPLHLASKCGHMETARMLIEHGADVSAQNKYGDIPLHLASREGQVEVARMLIERRADVSAQNEDGDTPLHLASHEGQVEVARMLIERGADVAAQNNVRQTPLLLVLTLLFGHRRRVGVSAQNKGGDTPLHLASQRGQPLVACILIEHGADVSAQNKDGMTPYRLASGRGPWFESVRAVLLKNGADTGESLASESPPVFFTRRLLCSLGVVAIAVALSFFIRNVPQTLAIG